MIDLDITRNPETGLLEVVSCELTEEELKDPLFCAKALRYFKNTLPVIQQSYKQKAQEAAKMDLAIKFLEETILNLIPEGCELKEDDIFLAVKEYSYFEITDEDKIPDDLKIKREVTQINTPLIKSLSSGNKKIPGVRRCKKLRVIVK